MDGRRKSWRAHALRGATALLVALVMAAGGATPAGAQTAPFLTDVGVDILDNDEDSGRGIVVVGDDMLVNGGVTSDADLIGDVNSLPVWISAANRASWVNYYHSGQQHGYATMSSYAALFQPRITVGALAMNDARIRTQSPSSYSDLQQYLTTYAAVSDTRVHSDCVLLVNMPVRSGVAGVSVARAQEVNANLADIAATHPSGDVFLADWKTYSAGQSTWFVAGSAQLTASGATSYALFVAGQVQGLKLNQGC